MASTIDEKCPGLLLRQVALVEDLGWIHGLWLRALDSRWSLSKEALGGNLAHSLCVIAEWNGVPVGFCAGTWQAPGPAALTVLLVDGGYRRKQIGSVLLLNLESELCQRGAKTLRLGIGAHESYFWPGVPVSNPPVWGFFAHHSWTPEDTVFDLVLMLDKLKARDNVEEELARAGYHLAHASAETQQQIEDFEALHLPTWAGAFCNKLRERRFEEVLVALTADNSVAGSALLEGGAFLAWRDSLGSACAAFSALGVAAEHRRQGLGSALAAHAFALAKGRGCEKCYINWTGLTEWYGRLGAKPWAEYTTSEKPIG